MFLLFDNEDTWRELEEMAKERRSTYAEDLLKAFYALEYIYHKLIPISFMSLNNMSGVRSAFMDMRFERSSYGLKELKQALDNADRHLSSRRVAAAMRGNGTNSSEQVAGMLHRPLKLIELCGEAATRIKASLNKDHFNPHSVGVRLGDALNVSKSNIDEVESVLRTILDITKERAHHPWSENEISRG